MNRGGERWAPIEGTLGAQVSSLGVVRDELGAIVKPFRVDKSGSNVVNVRAARGSKKPWCIVRVGRAVAKAFIPNPARNSYVNHLDGNKDNNRVDNLEWSNKHHYRDVTNRHTNYGMPLTEDKLMGGSSRSLQLPTVPYQERAPTVSDINPLNGPVRQYINDNGEHRDYVSIEEASASTGVSLEELTEAIRNEGGLAGGSIWMPVPNVPDDDDNN